MDDLQQKTPLSPSTPVPAAAAPITSPTAPPEPVKSENEQLKNRVAYLESRLAIHEDPKPAFQEFPKMVYLHNDTSKIVANAEEEKKAKADGYVNQPNTPEPKK